MALVCTAFHRIAAPEAAAAEQPTKEVWPTFHGGETRCGAAGEVRAAPGAKLLWKFQEPQLLERRPFASSPAIAAGRVLIGSDSYRLYCLDLETGKLQWKFDAQWPIFSSPAVSKDRVYFGEGLHDNSDCKLYCLDLATGKRLWAIQTASHTESSPTVADGRVYFGAGDDGVYCADALTGKVLWHHKGPHEDGCPLVVEDRVYVGSGYGFHGLLCLSARDGSLLWKKECPAPVWAAPSFAAGRLYTAIGRGTFTDSADNPYGEVRCLDPKTGNDLWRFTQVKDAVLTSVAVDGGCAVFGSRDGSCYALDATTGKLLWRAEVGSPILSSPAIAAGHVLFGADDGKFTCLRLKDGVRVWAVDTSDDVLVFVPDPKIQSSPAVAEGKVVFGSSNGTVYCLGGATK
jgi:outer membrane protein assembly factor BamB